MLFEDQLPFPTCDANCSIELGCIMQCSALMQCLTNSINQIVQYVVEDMYDYATNEE